MTTINLDFYPINDLILNVGGVRSAAELHGWLCGLLCGGAQIGQHNWWEKLAKYLELDWVCDTNAVDPELIQQFNDMLAVSTANIDDTDFSFTMLLPDEDQAELSRRIDELALWCREFLVGLASSGLSAEANLSSESAEILRDLAQVSLAAADDELSSENAESDWIELVEYVKITVLNLRAGLEIVPVPTTTSPQLH